MTAKTESSPKTRLPDGRDLYLPPRQRYECIQCGRSCGEFWEIRVEPEMASEIADRPKQNLPEAAQQGEPVVRSRLSPGAETMRLSDGHCCMLTGEGLCALHKQWGEKAKPNVCRSFPYRFVETPHGVYTGISFACTAVLENLGPDLEDNPEPVVETFDFTHYRKTEHEPPALAIDLPLTWAQYFAIETDLDELMASKEEPLEQRLLAQSVYIGLLTRFLREGRKQAEALTAEAEAHDQLFDRFRIQMRGDEAAWATIRRIAGRRRWSGMLRRVCLAVAHELRNVYGRPRGRTAAYARVLRIYFGAALGRGALQLPRMTQAVPLSRLADVAFDPNQPETNELLTRYFRHRLMRKDLLGRDEIPFAMNLQLLHWGLIQWYAAALAADDDQPEVGLTHLREAIRLVEKYYVLHSPMEGLFADYPMLRNFIDALMSRPLFAFSMARGEWSRP